MTASATAIAPLPVPDVGDAHRHAVDAVERRVDELLPSRARREHASGRGLELEVVEGRFHKLPAVTEWAAHARREEERYRDGEGRLPDVEDHDARQRQLTRMGNAAAGAGLAELMAGNTESAREWFAKAVERVPRELASTRRLEAGVARSGC